MLRISERRWALAGLLVSTLIVSVFIYRLNWPEFIRSLQRLDAKWILSAGILVALSAFLRAWRWQVLARLKGVTISAFWFSTLAGYIGNTVLPARAGEVLRLIALHRDTRAEPGRIAASSFLDRVADVIALAATGLGVTVSLSIPQSHLEVILTVLAVAFTLAGGVMAVARWGQPLERLMYGVAGRLSDPWGTRSTRWLGQALRYIQSARDPRVLAATGVLTVAATLIDYTAIWLCLFAMAWELPYLAAAVTGVFIALASLLPAAPGYVGVFQVAAVLGLKPFGIEEASALAFSIVMQVTVLCVMGLLGVWTLAHFGWNLLRLGDERESPQGLRAVDADDQTGGEL